MDSALLHLVDQAWQCFEATPSEFRASSSVPILFFGDLAAYQASPLRVVTVGLNPSGDEFPSNDPMSRFPLARGLKGGDVQTEDGASRYVQALSGYFKNYPYTKWFNGNYRSFLEGAGATYPPSPCVALHTDICSPVATDPKWSGLHADTQVDLMRLGAPLWNDLITYLEPQLVMISVRRAHIDRISIRPLTPWTPAPIELSKPCRVETSWREFPSGARSLIAFGQAGRSPLDGLYNDDKSNLGRLLAHMAQRGVPPGNP